MIPLLHVVKSLALLAFGELFLVFDFGGAVGLQALVVVGARLLHGLLQPVQLRGNSRRLVVILLPISFLFLKERKKERKRERKKQFCLFVLKY